MNALRLAFALVIVGCSVLAHADQQYLLILASHTKPDAAERVAESWRSRIGDQAPVIVIGAQIGGVAHYRVALGPFESREAARQSQPAGVPMAWIMERAAAAVAKRAPASDPAGAEPPIASPLPEVQARDVAVVNSFYLEAVELDAPVLADRIQAMTAEYVGREVSVESLFMMRDAINRLLVAEGYINSGVVIPDQNLDDGVLRLDFIAGQLSDVNIESDFRPGYMERRLGLAGPFNIADLQASLKLIEQHPMVTRVKANVQPGARLGEAELLLDVESRKRRSFGLMAANDRSPNVGAESLRAYGGVENLLGIGETLTLDGNLTEGLDAFAADIALPLNALEHTLSFHYAYTDAGVIEEPFDSIDIESRTESWGVGFEVPLHRGPNSHWNVRLDAEKHRNITTLAGQNFSFSEGADNGETRVAPLRLSSAWNWRGVSRSLAARLQVSRGTHAFNATDTGGAADRDYLNLLLQLQASRQTSERSWITVRMMGQRAGDALMSIEQYSLGGMQTVRGYRQNQLVRDHVLFASGEYRFRARPGLELVAFADWGRGWNHKDALNQARDTLGSVGAGVSWRSEWGLHADLFLAHGIEKVVVTESDLQDDGVHFKLGWEHRF